MHVLRYSCHSPAHNLAWDEWLLHCVEAGQYTAGICRLWESPVDFVVLGLSKTIAMDVNRATCDVDGVPIFKRCSGGGTVVQGSGCLNYAFILPISMAPSLQAIPTTTTFVLGMVMQALAPHCSNVQMAGISDLVIDHKKFSGNAQRRLRHTILFHGTILYNADLTKVTRYLKEPLIQPDYRQKRSHSQFIDNIPLTQHTLIMALAANKIPMDSTTLPPIPADLLKKYQPL
jgi:lipoate-protein ligase A